MNSQNNNSQLPCPCGSLKAYQDCCLRYISRTNTAPTPEHLMRSRYSAYASGAYQYIIDTYHSTTRPTATAEQLASECINTHWLSLSIMPPTAPKTISATEDQKDQDFEYVCFKAFSRQNGDFYCLHERSRFIKEEAHWHYLDGIILPDSGKIKLGRNENCLCGSGKKFKRCCDKR